MQAILDWTLDTYYRHYKLYQYAFTKRCVAAAVQIPRQVQSCC